MRFLALPASIIILAALALAGCSGAGSQNGSTPPANSAKANANTGARGAQDNVRRMTIAELREALDKGTAVVVDVRSEMQYNQEHIKGAILMPEGQVASRASELPKDKLIVFYCS